MNVQLMPLEINTMPQASNPRTHNLKANSKDDFSIVMEKSQNKQDDSESKKVKDQGPQEPLERSKKEIINKLKLIKKSSSENNNLEQIIVSQEESLELLADLLEIETEELENILASLQISVYDLLLTDNLQQLIMKVYDVEDPMELLLIPEVAEKLELITSMLEDNPVRPLENIKMERPAKENLQFPEEAKTPPTLVQAEASPNKDNDTVKNNDLVEREVEVTELRKDTQTLIKTPSEDSQDFSQNNDQSPTNQNTLTTTHEFLQNLSQSLGEAFQVQLDQVNEIAETVRYASQRVEPEVIIDQIIDQIELSVVKDEAQMHIQLKPEHLGKLSMEVISKQGSMTARFTVESERIKAIIEQNMQDLESVLKDKGLVIEKLEVTVGQDPHQDRHSSNRPKLNKNISEMINILMSEDALAQNQYLERLPEYEKSEVNFIA